MWCANCSIHFALILFLIFQVKIADNCNYKKKLKSCYVVVSFCRDAIFGMSIHSSLSQSIEYVIYSDDGELNWVLAYPPTMW